jgi:hypothetical protein
VDDDGFDTLLATLNCLFDTNTLPLTLSHLEDFGDHRGAPLSPSKHSRVFFNQCNTRRAKLMGNAGSSGAQSHSIFHSLTSLIWSESSNHSSDVVAKASASANGDDGGAGSSGSSSVHELEQVDSSAAIHSEIRAHSRDSRGSPTACGCASSTASLSNRAR